MSLALPTLASGSVARYPVQVTTSAKTGIVRFVNGSEQRWREAQQITSFVLTYTNINAYDTSTMQAFFIARKGRFVDSALTNTFSVTLGSTTWNYCMFDQDDFTEIENRPGHYTFTLKITQVRPN
jgi:hypothetical protein